MYRTFRILSALPLFLALVSVACARHEESAPQPARSLGAVDPVRVEETLESTIPSLLERARIAGLSICLIRDNRLAWCDGFGVTGADPVTAVGTTTVFQAASLSKPVFAYTALRLADRGVIDLDTPLLEYIDEATARADYLGENFHDPRVRELTARMVLTHSSGFPNWRRNEELTFLFDPGERFGYSGEAYGLLQKVLERITGSSLEELADTHAFGPLGMEDTTFTPSLLDLGSYAWPHDAAGDREPVPGKFDELREKFGAHAAASLLTTAPDYARFLVALMTGSGLEELTCSDLMKPHVNVDGEDVVAWGLGTGIERSPEGVRLWHWGDNGNSKAFYIVDPARGDGLVYFSNSFNGLSIVRDLLELSMSGDHPLLDSPLLADYPPYDSAAFLSSDD
jgi:CubicO group peptidase (beta-lactamase class C family)